MQETASIFNEDFDLVVCWGGKHKQWLTHLQDHLHPHSNLTKSIVFQDMGLRCRVLPNSWYYLLFMRDVYICSCYLGMYISDILSWLVMHMLQALMSCFCTPCKLLEPWSFQTSSSVLQSSRSSRHKCLALDRVVLSQRVVKISLHQNPCLVIWLWWTCRQERKQQEEHAMALKRGTPCLDVWSNIPWWEPFAVTQRFSMTDKHDQTNQKGRSLDFHSACH